MTTYFNDLDSKSLQVDNVRINGNAITTTDTNGNLQINPNGSGRTTSTKSFDITGLKNNFFWNGVKNNDSTSTGSNITLPALEYLFTYLTNNSLVSIKEISIGNGNFGILYNATSNNITLQNQNGATPEIGIITGTGADLVLKPGQSVILYNEAVDIQGWIVLNTNFDFIYREFIDSTTTGSDQLLTIPINTYKIVLTNSSLISLAGVDLRDPGYPLLIINNTGNPITIVNNSGSVAASTKILTGTGNNLEIDDDAALFLNYNGNDNLWNIIGGAGGGGGFAEALEETIDSTSTGAVLDFNPLTTKTVFTVGALTSIRSIVAPPVPGTLCVLVDNTGSGFTLVHEDTGATAANRFSLPRNKNFELRESEAVILSYNGNINRWETLDVNTQYTDLRITDDLRLDGLLRLDETNDSTTSGSAQTIAVPVTGVLTLTDADLESIEGLSGATANQMLLLVNQTGRTITLLNESGTAANQIVTGEGQDSLMADGSSVWLYYGDNTKWNKVGNNNVNIPLIQRYTDTPTLSGVGTATSQDWKWTAVGDRLFCTGRFTTGTVAASPAGITLINSWSHNSTSRKIIGRWERDTASATSRKSGTLHIDTNGTVVRFGSDDYTTAANPFNELNGDTIFANTQVVTVHFDLPINQLSQNTISGLASQSTLASFTGTRSAAQSIPGDNSFNDIQWSDGAAFSIASYNAGTYTWTFTRAARIHVEVSCFVEGNASTNQRAIYINVNGSDVSTGAFAANGAQAAILSTDKYISVNSGDTLKARVSNNTGTSLNISSAIIDIQEVPFSTTSIATALVPTIQKFTSGSGTYTTPTGVKYLTVEMVGGGGGGASGGASSTTGTTGNSTTFGPMEAFGGIGGGFDNTRGIGGAASLGSGPIGIAVQGNAGSPGATNIGTASFTPSGGTGGAGPWGGAGIGGYSGATGTAGAANSGAGGGGGSGNAATGPAAGGGGAGGYIKAQINNPAASYSYSVGSGGAGAAGSVAGQAGGSGVIIVTEHY